MAEIEFNPPAVFQKLWEAHRYKILLGGRGGGKSYGSTDFLLAKSLVERCRIGCFREIQLTIKDSSHKLLADAIIKYKLSHLFKVTQNSIIAIPTGSEFIFKGLRHSINEIKSTEGIKYAWVDEAQNVSQESWDVLIPTIRVKDSEIIISYNPYLDSDATHQFYLNPRPDTAIMVVNYWDNPFFPDTLKKEMEYCKKNNYDDYLHIWEGQTVKFSDAQIFKGKYESVAFEPPPPNKIDRWFIGVDWGFSVDATAVVGFYIQDECLWIRYEAGGVEIELDENEQVFDSLGADGEHKGMCRQYPMKADCARPETIRHMEKKGFDIKGAKKWAGSVQDGITFLKNFKKIYIHPDCKNTLDEFRLYSYKVDRNTKDILPIIVDKHNHHMDAIRYGLDGYITSDFDHSDYSSLFK